MHVFKFKDLGAFIRFKRLWLVSEAPARARMSQHANTVFASKNKKNGLFLARKTQDATRSATTTGDLRASRDEPR